MKNIEDIVAGIAIIHNTHLATEGGGSIVPS